MRAIVYRRFGPPEVLEEVELPKPAPSEHEVLIRVRATTVTAGDWRCRTRVVPKGFGFATGLFLGFSRPRNPILGSELAGEVESVGAAVTRFKAGDRVFAFTDTRLGCYVEYKCLPEDGAIALVPENLSFEEAAALSFGGTTTLGFFQKAALQRGERLLVNGASGGVGTAAVQLARHFGAEVTGVCSTANLELVRSLGAAEVIDYTKEDFTRRGETWDVIMDTAGTAPFSRCGGVLRRGGRLLAVLATGPEVLRAPCQSLVSGRKVIAGSPPWGSDALSLLARLAEAGEYRPVIDRRYAFDQMVEAHRYVDAGHKRGNVVVTV